ncbi:MAG: hypothetical protein JWM80_6656 [Cyanobacteria bacterium RYN_339]|nr:hypothetical protein [Cyanobacteria bacterium RYN_339]
MNDRYVSHGPLCNPVDTWLNKPLHKVAPFHVDITVTGGQPASTGDRPRARAFADVYIPSSR